MPEGIGHSGSADLARAGLFRHAADSEPAMRTLAAADSFPYRTDSAEQDGFERGDFLKD